MRRGGIGIDVQPPKQPCDDANCPFHGSLRVRGIILTARAYKKTRKTLVVERQYYRYVTKYRRYERRRSRISVHCPPCIDPKVGENVTIAECRPISKTVSFVVISATGGK